MYSQWAFEQFGKKLVAAKFGKPTKKTKKDK